MSPRILCLLVVVVLYCGPVNAQTLSSSKSAQPAAAYKPGALPKGAVARLGSLDFRTGRPVQALRLVDGGKTLVASSFYSNYTSSPDTWFFHLDAKTGQHLHVTKHHLAPPLQFVMSDMKANPFDGRPYPPQERWALSTDGRLLANVEYNKSEQALVVRDLRTGKEVFRHGQKKVHFQCLRFAPGGDRLAAVVAEGKDLAVVRIWDIELNQVVFDSGKLKDDPASAKFRAHSFQLSADGALLAAVGHESWDTNSVRFWDLANGGKSWRPENENFGIGLFALSPDGKYFAEHHKDKVRLRDTATGKVLRTLNFAPEGCAGLNFSPDGKVLVGYTYESTHLWKVAEGKAWLSLPGVMGIVYAPDRKSFAAIRPESVAVYSATSGKQLWSAKGPFGTNDASRNLANAQQGTGWPVVFSPDSTLLHVSDDFGSILRFKSDTGKEIVAPGQASGAANTVAFAPDGSVLAAACRAGVALWDLKKGRCVHVYGDGSDMALRAVFSPDGQRLAGAWAQGTVSVWDTKTRQPLFQKKAGLDHPSALTFAPNGDTLIAAESQGQFVWWDVPAGKVIRHLKTKNDINAHMSGSGLAPDGRTALVFNHLKQQLVVWELASGKARHRVDIKYADLGVPVYSTNGQVAAATTPWNMAVVLDPVLGTPLRCVQTKSQARLVVPSPTGRYLATLDDASRLTLWHTATGTVLEEFEAGEFDEILTAAFAPDEKTLIASSTNSTLLVWDLKCLENPLPAPIGIAVTGKPAKVALKTPNGPGNELPPGAVLRIGSNKFQHGGAVSILRLLHDGKTLLTASSSGKNPGMAQYIHLSGVQQKNFDTLTRWDLSSGQPTRQMDLAGKLSLRWFQRQESRNGEHRHFYLHASDWAVSPDGTLLAHQAIDNRVHIRLLDLTTGKVARSLDGKQLSVTYLQFAPDGKRLAVACSDDPNGPIRLFDLKLGAEFAKLTLAPGDTFYAAHFSFSPHGRFLAAVGSSDREGAIRIWDLENHKPALRLPDYSPLWTPLTFAPDGKSLAAVTVPAGQKKSWLILYDPITGKMLRPLSKHNDVCYGLVFSPDGKYLASLTEDRVRLWEVASGKELPTLGMDGGGFLLFAPDGKQLVVGTGQGLSLYDTATWKLQHQISEPLTLGAWQRAPATYHYSPDHGKDHVNSTPKQPLTESLYYLNRHGLGLPVAYTADGKYLLAADGHAVRQWDAHTGKEIGADERQPVADLLALSPDGKLMAAATGQSVWLWDVAARRKRHELKLNFTVTASPAGPTAKAKFKKLADDPAVISTLAFAPDGSILAVGYSSGHVLLWDTTDGKQIRQLNGHQHRVCSLHFSPDGQELRSADDQLTVTWWDVRTGARGGGLAQPAKEAPADSCAQPPEIITFDEFVHHIGTQAAEEVSLSPDGKSFAVAGGQSVRVVMAESGKEVWSTAAAKRTSTIHYGKYMTRDVIFDSADPYFGGTPGPAATVLAFSPDSRFLAYSVSGGLTLADVATGKRVRSFGLMPALSATAFSPDGRYLAAAGSDGVLVWDTSTGTLIARRDSHRSPVKALAFSADGRYLLTSGLDTTVLFWDLTALCQPLPPAALTAQSPVILCDQLGSDDPAVAAQAMSRLAQLPGAAVPALKSQLKAVTAPEAKDLARWIRELDSDSYAVRVKASAALREASELARPALEQALQKKLSSEHGERLEQLLNHLRHGAPPATQLKSLRAVEILERLGTQPVHALLAELAQGAPLSRVTQEAQAALQRLKRMP